MLKIKLLMILFLLSIILEGQNTQVKTSKNEAVILNFEHLTNQQLFDTANYYNNIYNFDTALIYYNIIINTPIKENDIEQKKRIILSYQKSAHIYYIYNNYRRSFEFLIKALNLSEKYDVDFYYLHIYTNIGNIYADLKNYNFAENYYLKALNLFSDSANIVPILINLGSIKDETGKQDSAFYYYNKAFQINNQKPTLDRNIIFNNLGESYYSIKLYDSAFYYYNLSLEDAIKYNRNFIETASLGNLGKLYFEINKTDSAIHYLNMSNKIALENNYLRISVENYLLLSKIEETKGNTKKALEYFKTYAEQQDSIYNSEKIGEINQMQRLYEVSKTNQQIEKLFIDKQIRENKIKYQRIFWFITFGVLLLVITVSSIIFSQKRNLSKAYKVLVEKNVENIEIHDNPSEVNLKKSRKNYLSNNEHNELINKVLIVMNDKSVFCNSDFSLDKLAKSINSNQLYVSEAIHSILGKNFRSFLNSYRIREAQRLLSEFDEKKHTIELIAEMVGFKSRNAFYVAFKDITGVTPGIYLKSIQEKTDNN